MFHLTCNRWTRESSNHVSVALSHLVKSKSISLHDWKKYLNVLKIEKHQISASTGKEVALTLFSLSRAHNSVRHGLTGFDSIINDLILRAIQLVPHSMNEQSIAIAAIAVDYLEDSLPPARVFDFV